MHKPLTATLTTTYTGKPLAVVDNLLPGVVGAELRPAQLRELAATLERIADDCEARIRKGRKPPAPVRRDYLPT